MDDIQESEGEGRTPRVRGAGMGDRRRERERRAWLLRHEHGATEREIGEALGVSQATISGDLRRVESGQIPVFVERVEQVKLWQTARLLEIARLAREGWERSCADAALERVTTGRAEVTKGGVVVALPDEVVREQRGQAGNPAFLAQEQSALAGIRAIWGLDAPKAAALTVTTLPKAYVGFDPEAV